MRELISVGWYPRDFYHGFAILIPQQKKLSASINIKKDQSRSSSIIIRTMYLCINIVDGNWVLFSYQLKHLAPNLKCIYLAYSILLCFFYQNRVSFKRECNQWNYWRSKEKKTKNKEKE